jgi:hypothetical protein
MKRATKNSKTKGAINFIESPFQAVTLFRYGKRILLVSAKQYKSLTNEDFRCSLDAKSHRSRTFSSFSGEVFYIKDSLSENNRPTTFPATPPPEKRLPG